MAAPLVRLVVLNFNGGEDVLRCVDSLFSLDWPATRLDVLVIDNASADGSADAVEERFPAARVLRMTSNTGFPANNVGFGDLDGVDFVGLVNNDAFVERGFLQPLAATLEADAELGAACPKILLTGEFLPVEVDVEPGSRLVTPAAVAADGWEKPDDLRDPRPVAIGGRSRLFVPLTDSRRVDAEPDIETDRGVATARIVGPPVELVNNVGNELVDGWFAVDRGLHEPDEGQFDEPVDVPAWCGAAVLLSVPYLRDVGGFDPRLFLYYEDFDLAWRGRARGWRYRTAPASVVRHRLGASTGVGSATFRYHVERNRLVVLAKNAPARAALQTPARYLLATASYIRRDVLTQLVRGRRPFLALVGLRLRAFGGYLWLLPHAVRERRRINRSATVSPSERVDLRATR